MVPTFWDLNLMDAGVIGGFLVWGVYTEFNPTPEMVAATQTAHAEGQIYAAMEQNSATAPTLPIALFAEHTKGKRESTEDVHEKGKARKRARFTDKKRQHDNWDDNANRRKPGKSRNRGKKKGALPVASVDTEENRINNNETLGSGPSLVVSIPLPQNEMPK